MEISKKENLVILWITWHFYQVPVFLLLVWKNYLVFCADFFSIPLLCMTLLSPWRKTTSSNSGRFAPVEWVGNIIFNTFSRILGAFLRLVLIVAGIIAQMIVVVTGAVGIIFWILLPFMLLGILFLLFHV